jgi:hypothetical protein
VRSIKPASKTSCTIRIIFSPLTAFTHLAVKEPEFKVQKHIMKNMKLKYRKKKNVTITYTKASFENTSN